MLLIRWLTGTERSATRSEYIKREDAEKIITEAIKQAEENTGCVIVDTFTGWSSIESYAKEAMSDAPTADVVEVRHGRWLRVGQSYIDPNKFLCFECSICGYTLDNHIKVEQSYCPNCGARMDGEEE